MFIIAIISTSYYSNFVFNSKVSETGKRLKSLLAEEVKPAIDMISECVADWYKLGQANYVQVQILEKDIESFEHSIFEIKEALSRIKIDLQNELLVNRAKNSCSISKDPHRLNGGMKLDVHVSL